VNVPEASIQEAFALKKQGKNFLAAGELVDASACFLQSFMVASEYEFLARAQLSIPTF
jgi:hypothetical protein